MNSQIGAAFHILKFEFQTDWNDGSWK